MPWTKEQRDEEIKRQELGDRLVRNEVYLCVSGLISRILADAKEGSDLAELAMELTAPVLDYEEAARQTGWNKEKAIGGRDIFTNSGQNYYQIRDFTSWETLCKNEKIDPYEWEIFEHWAVSDWLGDKLLEAGERVEKDFYRLTIWGRTCTGQSLCLDGVIQKIAKAVYGAERA